MKARKIALVTGAAKRIGRSIALHLAAQGYDIALHYCSSEKEAANTKIAIEELGRQCTLFAANLIDAQASAQLVPDVVEQMGMPNLVIHNASLFMRDQLENYTQEALEKQMHLHCFSALALARGLKEANAHKEVHSHLILLGDGMQGWSISPTYLSYSISKLAMAQLPALLARELAPHIRINMIGLGATLPGNEDDTRTFDKLASIIPMQTVSSPEEVCACVGFLHASTSVTGQQIMLSGGMHLSHIHT